LLAAEYGCAAKQRVYAYAARSASAQMREAPARLLMRVRKQAARFIERQRPLSLRAAMRRRQRCAMIIFAQNAFIDAIRYFSFSPLTLLIADVRRLITPACQMSPASLSQPILPFHCFIMLDV